MTSPVNFVDPTGHWFAPPELIDGDYWRSGPLRYNDPRVVPEPEPIPEGISDDVLGPNDGYDDEMISNIEAYYPSSDAVLYELMKTSALGGMLFPISGDLLDHALYGKGTTYYPDYGNRISRNKLFRNNVRELLETVSASSFSNRALECSFTGKNDLAYSLGKVTFNLSGTLEDGKWDIIATVSDTYDFDNWRTPGSIGNDLNNQGLASQYYGKLDPYFWSISFNFTIKDN